MLRPRRPGPRRGRAGAGRRPDRRRQVDAARGPQRTGAVVHGWPALRRRAARRGQCAGAATTRTRARRGVRRPGPDRRLRHRHRRGGARLRDGAARPRTGHDAAAGGGDARPARDRRPAQPRPADALGRPAAARRDRVGADDAPARARARRAHLGAGPDGGRGGPRDADPARARPRRDRGAGRAPARAGGAVRRPGRAGPGRRGGAVRRHREHAAGVSRGAADRRARALGRLVATAAVGARRPA